MKLLKAYEFIKYAEKQILENKLSPDEVCGREKLEKKLGETVCAKTLYNYYRYVWVYMDVSAYDQCRVSEVFPRTM